MIRKFIELQGANSNQNYMLPVDCIKMIQGNGNGCTVHIDSVKAGAKTTEIHVKNSFREITKYIDALWR